MILGNNSIGGTHVFQVTARRRGKNQFGESQKKHGHSSGEIQETVIAAHPFLLIHRGQHIMIGMCKYKNLQQS